MDDARIAQGRSPLMIEQTEYKRRLLYDGPTHSLTTDLIAALEASRAECARLRVALVAEWACNHQERCDNTTLFHDDKPAGPYGCLCPLPDVVTVEQARAALNGAADATVGSEP